MRGEGSSKRIKNKFKWSDEEVAGLLEYMAACYRAKTQKHAKNQAARFLTTTFGRTFTPKIVRGRLRTHEKMWKNVMKLRLTGGVGWNEREKMVTMREKEASLFVQVRKLGRIKKNKTNIWKAKHT